MDISETQSLAVGVSSQVVKERLYSVEYDGIIYSNENAVNLS